MRQTENDRGQQKIATELPAVEKAIAGRVPRISRLMALAIRFDGVLRDGVVRDQTELARLAHVTQPRMTQILNLLHLAPDIQEQILFLPRVVSGKDPIHEKMLRPIVAEDDCGGGRLWRRTIVAEDDCGGGRLWRRTIVAEDDWGRQREMWGGLCSQG